MSVFDTWAANVAKAKSEQAAVSAVIVGLASQNYKTKPAIGSGRQSGSTFRIYHWSDTPAGDLILLTGASIEHTLVRGSDLEHSPKQGMIYILADDVSDKVKEKVDKTLSGRRVKNLLAKAAGEGTPRTGPQRAPKLHTPADTSATPAKRRGRPPGTGKKAAEPEVKVVEAPVDLTRPPMWKAPRVDLTRPPMWKAPRVDLTRPPAWKAPKPKKLELSPEEREADQADKLMARLRAKM